ncbi:MAG: hypothetical protein Q9163_005863 [Psora crenata]
MNGRSAGPPPPSPYGSEWSGLAHYQSSQPPPSPGFPYSRGNSITPSISGSSNGTQPRVSNGMIGRPGGPSPPHSTGARWSQGTTTSSSDPKRMQTVQMEDRLSQHYTILKRFLGQSLRDEKGNPKPNKARDKLLRLSSIQFQELSTDVYDELLRRQSAQGQQTNGPGQVPAYLLPKQNFHPKRNQARQRLATLPPSRFRDLATDVFYELERRFPNFPGRDIPPNVSPALEPPSRLGTPNGVKPGGPGYAPRNQSLSGQVMGGMGIPGGAEDQYSRPTAKQSQSNTIIPNKSTMVEDDDDDGLSDVYGNRRDTTYTSRSTGGFEKDRKAVVEFEIQVHELRGRVKELEDKLRDKDSELSKLKEQHDNATKERKRSSDFRTDLEIKLQGAHKLNETLQLELDKVRSDHAASEREIRLQVDAMTSRAAGESEWKGRYETLDKSHQDLRLELSRQEKVTSEVRQEATGFLNTIRELSERSTQSFEREEKLILQVQRLESELKEWKSRYVRAKSSASVARSPSIATSIKPPDVGHMAKDGRFTMQDGLVKDLHVTNFQIAIDELLQSARSGEHKSILPHVKSVVIAVRKMSLEVGDTPASNDEATLRRQKLKTNISASANNLITAAKNFAMSHGLFPVSLVDAAASNLATSIIELIQIVKLRSSPMEDPQDDGNSDIVISPADYYGIGNDQPEVSDDSMSSSTDNIRQLKRRSFSGSGQRKPVPNGVLNGVPLAQPQRGYINGDSKISELKTFLDSRTNTLLGTLQDLVSSIRASAPPTDILDSLQSLTSTAGQIIHQTLECVPPGSEPSKIGMALSDLVQKLEEKGREGEEVKSESDWKEYVNGLPPMCFAIAREVKELGGWFEGEVKGGDFN